MWTAFPKMSDIKLNDYSSASLAFSWNIILQESVSQKKIST